MEVLKPKYSFICCCNNQTELQNMLLSSLSNFSHEGNIIIIDTKEKTYKSAAEAFNKEAMINKDILADVLIFLHQDMAFKDCSIFNHILDILCKENNAILGVAGAVNNSCMTNLQYKANNEYIVPNALISKMERVQTLDECFFCMRKETFFAILFDEEVCDHWHLYAADFCLTASERLASPIYVLPEVEYHKFTPGGLTVDNHFLRSMFKLCRKHQKNHNYISTTCYATNTSFPWVLYTLIKYYIAWQFSRIGLMKLI